MVKLFIPGPTDVAPEVLAQLSRPMISHRGTEATELQSRISRNLQKIMRTEETILLSGSSGTGLMEGAVRSCTRRRAAVFSIGAFGQRWFELCESNAVPADLFAAEPGEITRAEDVAAALETGKYDLVCVTHNETSTGIANPLAEIAIVMRRFPEVVWCVDAVSSLGGEDIPVDELGIDICITSAQKCLALPPGLALCSFSEKARRAANEVPSERRGQYFDLLNLDRFVREKKCQYPSTPPLSLYYALDYQLERILAEGLEARFARHLELAELTRDWARENMALFGDREHLSRTVTCIDNVHNIDVPQLVKNLEQRGYLISNGYGQLKNRTFRVAHMGERSRAEMEAMLAELSAACAELRH
ncbi:MAG: alanine--glyoxylate aminotransferase family protein [Clostridiaceae bacterium]|mgnify:CR=1 FL=1|nr:alanine--glyoxylate aminotransferase family protein [Clostridiaceae bacterium]